MPDDRAVPRGGAGGQAAEVYQLTTRSLANLSTAIDLHAMATGAGPNTTWTILQ